MKHIRLSSFLLVFIFSIFQASAQKLDSAILIVNDSVRFRGFVRTDSQVNGNDFIEFKRYGSETFKMYMPNEALGYEIIGESVYESLATEEGQKFLRYVVEGEASLLERFVPLRTIYYVKLKGENPYQLRYEEKVVNDGDYSYTKIVSFYKQTLKGKLTGCIDGGKRIDRIKNYGEKELVSFFVFYNQCSGGDSVESKSKIVQYKRSAYLSMSAITNFSGGRGLGGRIDWSNSRRKMLFSSFGISAFPYPDGLTILPFVQINHYLIRGKILEPYGFIGMTLFPYFGGGLKINFSEKVFFRMESLLTPQPTGVLGQAIFSVRINRSTKNTAKK